MIAAQLGKCSINVDVVSEPNDEGRVSGTRILPEVVFRLVFRGLCVHERISVKADTI